tara:strand:+ start:22714 stop:24162 length:1449 start_codon:yes stop_codon:yes gene_type:complete
MSVIDLNKVFLGIVEDNNDPDRENKCRIRVINLFDGLPVEDLPWASPWKDTNGMTSNLPDNGKIVSVEFENGDIYTPIYRYAEHYNVNLETKLKDMSDDDYLSMKSLLFDHKTQVYTNESEGLKLDHKFNLINIINSGINLNLKDNHGLVNIGTENADQKAILGDNFLNWFDEFVSHLLGEKGGPYYGNLYAPIIPNPGLAEHLAQYKILKDPKFLSHNVRFNDNGYIDKLDRLNKGVLEDDWKMTEEDHIIKTENGNYNPIDGSPNPLIDEPNNNELPIPAELLDGDPAPSINPSKIGSTYYSQSPLSKKVIKDLGKNGLLDQSDPSFLVFIGDKSGANYRYINPVTNSAEYMLHPVAFLAWVDWRKELISKGIPFRISSAYRSIQHQRGLGSSTTIAQPGSSPHGVGGALDFGNLYQVVNGSGKPINNLAGRKNKIYSDIAEIGAKYGWYNPWRLSDNNGTLDEIWHFEYWGEVYDTTIT